jgi:hypothetical protein
VIPPTARRHVLVLSANHLLGLYLPDPDAYAAFRGRTPDAVLAGSLLVFDVTTDPAALAQVRALAGR